MCWGYVLKDKLISLRASIALRSNKTPRYNPNLKVTHHIGIICDVIDESSIRDRLQVLVNKKKLPSNIEIICISNNSDADLSRIEASNCISYKKISIIGKIKNAALLHFIKSPFDYLVSLSLSKRPIEKFILAKSRAKCRVGIYDEEFLAYYDFMVKLNENSDTSIELRFEKIFNYLKLII